MLNYCFTICKSIYLINGSVETPVYQILQFKCYYSVMRGIHIIYNFTNRLSHSYNVNSLYCVVSFLLLVPRICKHKYVKYWFSYYI